MIYQTWLKKLKRSKRTWKPRRSPLVPKALSSTAFWIHQFCPAAQECLYLLTQSFCSYLIFLARPWVLSEQKWGHKFRTLFCFQQPCLSLVFLLSIWETIRLELWC